MDRKSSTQEAINRFIKKNMAIENSREPKRRNNKPEQQTEKSVLQWAKLNGFFLHVIESSSYDPRLGRKGVSRTRAGMPDLIGNTPLGLSCYIELKAKDRRCALKDHQRAFLIEKIEQNCFAVVVDNVDKLAQYWKRFCTLKTSDERKHYLIDCLPKKKALGNRSRDEFERNHGF